jgi:glycerophosphoryl diester phosphodiesterase
VIQGGSPAISAHRGGSERAAPGTYQAYGEALAAGADYVELDVRRTADGVLVSCHRERVGRGRPVAALSYSRLCRLVGYEVPRLDEALRLLAGRGAAHLDLKDPSVAAASVDQALAMLGSVHLLVTTRETGTAAALAVSRPSVAVGVTVGGDLPETARFAARRARHPRLSRLEPGLAAGAGWAVVHQRLARSGLLAECRSRGLATVVWTVNRDAALARWLACPAVDVLVTDRPSRAAAIRASPS